MHQNYFVYLQQKLNSKLLKACFFGAIIILIILLVSFFVSWHEDAMVVKKSFQSIKENNLDSDKLAHLRLLPNLKNNFWHRSLTFTYLTNAFVAVALFIFVFSKNQKLKNIILPLAAIYITITFVIFWGLVFPALFKNKDWTFGRYFATINVHFINPLFYLVLFFLTFKQISITRKTVLLAPIPMFIYWVVALMIYFIALPAAKAIELHNLNSIEKDELLGLTIYKFLNFLHPLFYKENNIWIILGFNLAILIVGISFPILIGLGYRWICNKYHKKAKLYNE
ncbi:MAGa3780 family membrane protein [Mycoplasmopsis gallopavonis]|uniref:Uncharacterized protein n=1 Tax=Mycoplasmopsis gallopavonis TaxID=76629 RepID=A0A449AZE1_9BACT|nr:hypothetical protein [Mycoplasmopsis gallopavonis]RIV16647.1 hypothetical protein D1113_01490 [Mycoplasmopsis gallopavonis]VEU72854.1 Uncharacterised protein [Mycoplasmopsis gallopavonis]